MFCYQFNFGFKIDMCGILGVYSKNGDIFPLKTLKGMAEKVAHRGPDGEGYFIDNHIALAHKRLAILDTSPRANQPMAIPLHNRMEEVDFEYIVKSLKSL